jgi:glucosamine kinase
MAVALFEAIGGPEWASTREYIYGRDRGSVGRLALAVAKSAGDDAAAQEILSGAGVELARLASAMTQRYGPRPVALTGRAAELHPLIAQNMRAALPSGFPLTQRPAHGHHAAARIALRTGLEREARS